MLVVGGGRRGEPGRQSVRAEEEEEEGGGKRGKKKGGKGTQQRPYVQCDPHYSQLGQPSVEWSRR